MSSQFPSSSSLIILWHIFTDEGPWTLLLDNHTIPGHTHPSYPHPILFLRLASMVLRMIRIMFGWKPLIWRIFHQGFGGPSSYEPVANPRVTMAALRSAILVDTRQSDQALEKWRCAKIPYVYIQLSLDPLRLTWITRMNSQLTSILVLLDEAIAGVYFRFQSDNKYHV